MMADTVIGRGFAPADSMTAAVIQDIVDRLPQPAGSLLGHGAGDVAFPLNNIDLQQASDLLGEDIAYGLGLACFADHVFDPSGHQADVSPAAAEHRRHAVEVAAIADELNSRSARHLNRGVLIASALLHDVGKLLLHHCIPKAYERVCADSRNSHRRLTSVERAALGVDHLWAGKRLVEHWNLPGEVQDAIALHHHPPETINIVTEFEDLVTTIQLANFLAHREPFGHPERATTDLLDVLFKHLQLNPAEAESVIGSSMEQAERLHDMLRAEMVRGIDSMMDERALQRGVTNRFQALEGDQRVFGAVAEFASAVARCKTVMDVRREVLRSWCDLVKVRSAVVFTANVERTAYNCSVLSGGGVSSTLVTSGNTLLSRGGADEAAADLFARGLIPAPPIADPVRERFRRELTGDLQLMPANLPGDQRGSPPTGWLTGLK